MSETLLSAPEEKSRIDLLPILVRAANVAGLAIVILVLIAIVASLAPGFLSPFNLFTLTRNLAIDTVIGFAMMVVLATGGMNLAVGSIGVCSIMITGYLLEGLGLPIIGLDHRRVGCRRRPRLGKRHPDRAHGNPQLRHHPGDGQPVLRGDADPHARRGVPRASRRLQQPGQGPIRLLFGVAGRDLRRRRRAVRAVQVFAARAADPRRRRQPGCGEAVRHAGGQGHRHRPRPVRPLRRCRRRHGDGAPRRSATLGRRGLAAARRSWRHCSAAPCFPVASSRSSGRSSGRCWSRCCRTAWLLLQVGSFWVQFFLGLTLLIAVALDRWRSVYVQRTRVK